MVYHESNSSEKGKYILCGVRIPYGSKFPCDNVFVNVGNVLPIMKRLASKILVLHACIEGVLLL